ncbi:AP-4 complex accessory subunit tepsin [Willisornis vidua]|uniref:AP-4 complex accessory subunit tepsin n=1 Tax=Willisornis vidua TaxID=1566151 RepID=A0ABQ9DNC7_9PASS|nr:AP-4 complex accessory subunit tepsin [Willisornis vidua]
MAAPLRDRLSFLSRLPVLLRGTADDDTPCPGYLFEEIAKISHESPGSSQCLLEHLLTRLQSSSCHVKLKVLKILLHTCTQGSPQFVLQLKRNASFIREAAVFSGPPDPLHGHSLNQKVRAAAQDLASLLFSDVPLPQPLSLPARPPAPAGMGSSPSPCGALQGFGFSSDRSSSVSHQPGLAGGGWEEADSGHSSRESSQGHEHSRASDSGSKSGSDSRSGASRELSHGAERCGLLNCEVVLELLGRALEDPSDSVRMRSMSALSTLGCSDLLSPEQIFAVTRQHLQQLSQGSPGPVANRATKVTLGVSLCPV